MKIRVWFVTFPMVVLAFILWLMLARTGFITFDDMVIWGFVLAGVFFAVAGTIVLEERRLRDREEKEKRERGIPDY